MKRLLAASLLLMCLSASAQTLFRYGHDSVSVKEFLQAYNKNNTGKRTAKTLSDYLDLYIISRLKIKEAKARGYDTLPQLVSDLDNLRQQVLPNYINDKESINRLVDEAFDRSQKDIHLAHIFISFQQNGMPDSSTSKRKLNEALIKLKSRADFSEIAKQYSDDPAAKLNGGDLGYITAFTLPYALENLAYTTGVGQLSTVYQSKAGYHIFKNLGEKRDLGKVKAAQILLAFPPNADEQTKAAVKNLADSIYMRLQKGDDFGKLAAQFSNDVISAASNGQMQEFGAGQYGDEFETVAFQLQKDGAISQPFLTAHGYHIIKRLGRVPLAVNKKDAKAREAIQLKVEQSDRMNTTKSALAQKVLRLAAYKKLLARDADLWAFSDSMLNYKAPVYRTGLTNESPLFKLEKDTSRVYNWISYAQTYRYKSDGSGVKPYPQLWNEFVEDEAMSYYQRNLENYNEEFRRQIKEFKEGNLFFEIMQREIWGPAQNDSTALLNYYQKNKSKYKWNKSADAVIFYATDPESAKTYGSELKKAPALWHYSISNFSEKITADSSRFELAQIPNPTKLPLKAGVITAPLVNKADNTASFAYILRTYEQPAPRSFMESRGLVINDYQAELEKEWVKKLKEKYPVRINQAALKSLQK
jgi:peptidyl-prolyl cis-trans isomerase SurA